MAFYGIGNLFGPIPKPETREKEKNRESEDKKKAEQASKKEEIVQEKQVQVQEQATQAEAQRQRLLQLQEKVARKLEDFVRASGREHAEGTEGDAEGLMQQLGNEGDSFTPENLQRLRQLSQNANSAMRAAREGRGEARADEGSRRPETDLPKPQVTSAQDLELQMRRASQELKNQQKQLDEQATGRPQQHARETGRDTASDTRSQKAQEGPQGRQAAGEGTAAKPQAEQAGTKGDLQGAKPQADAKQPQGARPGGQEPPRAELPPRHEGAKADQPRAELPKPELPKAELPKPELPKAELPKAGLPKAELPKAELPKAELPKAELPKPEGREGADTARGHEPETPPPPPRPDAVRARPEAPTSRAAEAKPEAKSPEGKPQAEGQEPAAQPRLGTTPRFGAAVRPEAGAPRPGETTADRPQGTRPEAGRQSTSETGAQTGSRQSPAPEGPRNARGQETVGGAAVTTGGTPNEKAQARLGDMRLSPHLEAQKPDAAKPQGQGGKEQAGKAGAEQDQAGKPAAGAKGQGNWSSMGLGGIRPGLTPPLYQRPGLGNQAPGQNPQLGNQAPGTGQPTRPGAGQPAGPSAGPARPGAPAGGTQGPVFTPGFGMPKPTNPEKPSGPVFTPGFGMPKSANPEKPSGPVFTPGFGMPKSETPEKPGAPGSTPASGTPKSADPQKPSGPTFTPGFGMPKSVDPQKPGNAAPQAPGASPSKEPPAEAGPGWKSIPAVGGGGFRPPAYTKPAAPAAGAPAGQAPPKSEPTDSAPGWKGIPSVGGGFRAPQFSRPSFPGGGAPDLAPDPDAPMPEPPRATPRPGGPQAPGGLPKAGAPAAKPPETAPKEGGPKKDPEGKAPAESGPGWKAIPTVGSGYRPPVAPQYPPGQQGPGGPQGPQGPEAGRPPSGRVPVEGEPPATPGAAPAMPRSGHLGPIRIPPPDGGKDPGARDDESHDVELGDGTDFDPGWRPNRPGSATPVPVVRGPRHERGPVEEVDPRLSDARKESSQEGSGWKRLPGVGPGFGLGRAGHPEGRQAPGGPPQGAPGVPGAVSGVPDGRSRAGAPLLGGPTTPGGSVPGDAPDGFEHTPGHVNFDLLRRSPFRAAVEGVADEGQAPGPAGSGGATGRSPGQWQGIPGVGATSGGAGAYRAAPPQAGGPQAGGPDVPGKALGDAPTPRVEFLRPRASAPQPSLLTDSTLHPQGPGAAGPRPGAPLPAAQAAEAAERARVAAQILSGDSQYLGSSAGPVGRLLDPALPGEFRATLTSPTSSRLDPNSPLRAAVPRGPMTGGRPVTAHVPVYQPMLDLIYMIRGKGKVDQESTPIKMTLSGMVGTMDRESYTPRTAPPTQEKPRMQPGQRPVDSQNQSSGREQVTVSQRQVFDASEQAPLLGTMTASMLGPGESTRPERATSSTKQQESQAKVDAGAQVVAEIGDAPGRERGGSTGGDGGGRHRGSEGSAGAHGEKGAPGAPAAGQATPEQQQRMQSLRLAATHEAFRISMEKLDRQMNQRRYEVAIRNASTSIESILKRVYRRQDLEDLDENEAVNSLVMMLKLGGEFTYAHSARVLDFAMDLADEMGVTDEQTRRQIELGALLKDIGEVGVLMSQEEDDKIEKIADFMSTQDMRQAGLLHDIGKLRIPRDILYKPGRMTDEEYTLMKMHPIYGEQMVYPIASLRHLCPTIRGHHERWDGKGYPDGLRGDRIPLPARILAVADVFDALHAERPYKAGMEVSQARQILEEGKGTHFDPDCVDAFLRVLDRRFPQATRRRSHRAKILESVDA